MRFLTTLFSICTATLQFPSFWKQAIIVPIPKAPMKDLGDPLQYRGISLLSVPYKIFTHLINENLCDWLECNSILAEEQTGFRSGRGTIEHIFTVAETRLLLGLDSFAAFIDFRKAYDSIQHSLLWQKLQQIAMQLKILRILQCLYSGLSSSVRVNEWLTNSFSVTQALRQGCVLSPALFNILSMISHQN